MVTHLLGGDASKLLGKRPRSVRQLGALLVSDQVVSTTTLWRDLGLYALFVRRSLFGLAIEYGTAMELVGLSAEEQGSWCCGRRSPRTPR